MRHPEHISAGGCTQPERSHDNIGVQSACTHSHIQNTSHSPLLKNSKRTQETWKITKKVNHWYVSLSGDLRNRVDLLGGVGWSPVSDTSDSSLPAPSLSRLQSPWLRETSGDGRACSAASAKESVGEGHGAKWRRDIVVSCPLSRRIWAYWLFASRSSTSSVKGSYLLFRLKLRIRTRPGSQSHVGVEVPECDRRLWLNTVSYTHLTLPTILLV